MNQIACPSSTLISVQEQVQLIKILLDISPNWEPLYHESQTRGFSVNI